MASNTLTNTKISVTYAGVLHSAGVQLPATGLEYVYDGLGNRSSIRIGRDCSGMTVCGNLSATSLSTSVSLSANQLNTKTLLDLLHPVGTVLFTYNNQNPSLRTNWNVTTWEQISQGRFIVGVGTGNDGTNTQAFALSTTSDPGKYKHQLTVSEMPSHTHTYEWISDAAGTSDFGETQFDGKNEIGTTSAVGGNTSHNNIPPSFGLYIWRRTA